MSELLAAAVGYELRAMRKRAGLSRQHFATLIDSYGPTVSRFELGWNVPTLETLQLYAAVTGESLRGVARAIDRVFGLRPPRRVFARAPRS